MNVPFLYKNAATFVTDFLGGFDGPLRALLILVVVSTITDFMCALADKNFSQVVCTAYLFRKIMIFLIVGVAFTLDTQVIKGANALRMTSILCYSYYEGRKLLENAVRLGLPVPKALHDAVTKPIEEESEKDKK